MESKRLSQTFSCGHCSNIAAMESIGHIFKDSKKEDSHDPYPAPEEGYYYDVLICPACTRENIVKYFWHDFMESEEDVNYEYLYPIDNDIPLGLPNEIKLAYKAAQKVKLIDPNSYALLIRRLLELICFDREAEGSFLSKKLKHLADKGEIPEKLVKVAKGLRIFGNIGAHERGGSLSEKEIPILTNMIKSILEYIYTAPHLAELAERKLKEIEKSK
ncbi:DUF4145 domain-containing protein [Arenibacter sp. M-2]|uniref:DUF4145 domain-containing protein n=1 Tax=Arenibacter sp. M-2 TaxID=3053612 RepID=UPI00257074C2|nr:DUF4145 domain-containing protein [Arenibacter sp. M-2]MDL5512115.1 DUF4145 domain-containing protein [Arenibacter sp. M-2]